MDLEISIATELGISKNDLIPFDKGLSTRKFRIDVSPEAEQQIRNKFPKASLPLLIRTYCKNTHGEKFRYIAEVERFALRSLKDSTSVVFPKFFGKIQSKHYEANLVTWFDGRPPLDLSTAIRAWASLHQQTKKIDTKNLSIRSHYDIVVEAFQQLNLHFSTYGLNSETDFLDKFLELYKESIGRTDLHLIHGDFHLHNLLEVRDGGIAILDWEFAAVGDPLFDLMYCLFYDFGLQKISVHEFFNQRLHLIESNGIVGLSEENARITVASVLLLMSKWFFDRFEVTQREHNLAKGIIYLRGGLDLCFK